MTGSNSDIGQLWIWIGSGLTWLIDLGLEDHRCPAQDIVGDLERLISTGKTRLTTPNLESNPINLKNKLEFKPNLPIRYKTDEKERSFDEAFPGVRTVTYQRGFGRNVGT
ncbi:hypothetical protein V6N11_001578 [Hibiscus sabdariffa]|uniref:Uncharacterized protein n=1 Tax=Hibiscus sabdariffa TaxID=183260 RepID=A0ABR2S0Y6_9ROSI